MHYDVIVIGAGHAGAEAARASAMMGMRTCLFTLNLDTIGHMPCNPAIGGLAKGHLVREIDALGGLMAIATDNAGIQFRMLNRSKGPAVWSLRAQADRLLYKTAVRRMLENTPNLHIKQASIEKLMVENNYVIGVEDSLGISHKSKAVIITTGTFLNGLMHIGMVNYEAGRAGEFPAKGLSKSLSEHGLRLGRLKTGTPPRLDAKSIDFSKTDPQWGDNPPIPFSYSTEKITNPQLPCYITYTNPETHKIILSSLDRSPLYSGKIKGTGPRYCPSIEDKVVRFSDRSRHQVFLEPEGLETKEYYANGVSTSLPYDIQLRLIRSIAGLEQAEIMRPAYAIEYDFVPPTQINHSLECKSIKGLFLAGQINGTSGYEEAAAQGLMAGINAALKLQNKPPLILSRDEAYIGVLIDDLVTRGTSEPYRMFTSRAEYRLLLRHDNADMRLMEKGRAVGLVGESVYEKFIQKKRLLSNEIERLSSARLAPGDDVNSELRSRGTSMIEESISPKQLLRRPEVDYAFIERFSPPVEKLTDEVKTLVETEIKYEGYIDRQKRSAIKLHAAEDRRIPDGFDYRSLSGISREILGKLEEVRPESIGQASRIPGITPAALSLIIMGIEKSRRQKAAK